MESTEWSRPLTIRAWPPWTLPFFLPASRPGPRQGVQSVHLVARWIPRLEELGRRSPASHRQETKRNAISASSLAPPRRFSCRAGPPVVVEVSSLCHVDYELTSRCASDTDTTRSFIIRRFETCQRLRRRCRHIKRRHPPFCRSRNMPRHWTTGRPGHGSEKREALERKAMSRPIILFSSDDGRLAQERERDRIASPTPPCGSLGSLCLDVVDKQTPPRHAASSAAFRGALNRLDHPS